MEAVLESGGDVIRVLASGLLVMWDDRESTNINELEKLRKLVSDLVCCRSQHRSCAGD